MSRLTQLPAWQALAAHQTEIASTHLRDLFAADPRRAERFACDVDGLHLDYSKHRITDETLRRLLDLAEATDVRGWTRRMFAGEPINHTEGRAVLHVALRAEPARDEVRETLARMRAFSEAIRSGAERGATGEPFTHVVNIGIGGSDLGPRLAVRALRHLEAPRPRVHFVANVDPEDLAATLDGLDPATTLVIVASKTFTTAETLSNANRARAWVESALGHGAARLHFAAVSANVAAAQSFGIDPARVFPMWDWVGGRFSMWSAVGLPLMLAVGADRFAELLAGARAADEHFRTAPFERNAPVLMALLGVWYANFFGTETHAVLPYAEALALLPAYLQQLEMESNGKRVDRNGHPVDYTTAPVLWGQAGTNGQHAFHQLLHQGTRLVPCDFIVPMRGAQSDAASLEAHRALVANALAQSAAFMAGRSAPTEPHRDYPGNQPSTTILLPRLDARSLGTLIALYEHKVFVQGVIWNINSFDQWGVELGKELAKTLLPRLAQGGAPESLDGSTRALLARLRSAD